MELSEKEKLLIDLDQEEYQGRKLLAQIKLALSENPTLTFDRIHEKTGTSSYTLRKQLDYLRHKNLIKICYDGGMKKVITLLEEST